MKQIVEKLLSSTPTSIPTLPKDITAKDAEYVQESIRKNMAKKIQVNVLRLILAQCYDRLNNPDFIKPLLDVTLPQIQQTPFVNDARIRICEGIIKADQVIRAHTVENYLHNFEALNDLSPETKARLQIIRSGLNCLQSNFLKAAQKSLSASKLQFHNNDSNGKLKLVEQTMAYAFISQKNSEQHQLICTLYVHELAKKSRFYGILTKLYHQQMLNIEEISPLKQYLPKRINQKDTDQVSILAKALFAHNMLSILKSFSRVSLETVSQLIGVNKEQILLMIEKTYRNGELTVDLVDEYIEIADNEQQENMLVKTWFDKIDEVLGQIAETQKQQQK